MSETVTCEIEDGVALVTLNRPDRMNAVNMEMGLAFEAVMARLGLDDQVKAVVLTGAGERAFCAGADVARLEGISAGTESHASSEPSPLMGLHYAPEALRVRYAAPMALRQPVIAAVNGVSVGAGFVLAAASDIRFASSAASFMAVFAQRGLVAENGLAWTLTAILGRGRASDILLSGRRIGADEALEIGLVSAVLPPDRLVEHALDYARGLARTASPRSLAVIKRQLRLAPEQSYAEALELDRAEVAAALQSGDFREGLASFRDKRPPNFKGD
ncbi:MAG: enoyl-CoA hydratase/isomerase family protein [Caulobacteraceae bacterium]|nr:enoyl-CoA hydratase/isomerase family protein [Caulobacteraceae bacterium]